MTGDRAGKRSALGWAGRWLVMLPIFVIVGLAVTWVSQLTGHPAGRGMWYSLGLLWLASGFGDLTKAVVRRWRDRRRPG